MLMQLCELKYRSMTDPELIWEKRYRAALQYDLRDSVNLDEIDRILGLEAIETPVLMEVTVETQHETWRDRRPLL